MASQNNSPNDIGELIDQIARIREELLSIQRSMEIEPAKRPDGESSKAK